MQLHRISYSKKVTEHEGSHGHQWQITVIFVDCSCGWKREFQRSSDASSYIDHLITEHKIEVILRELQIEFDVPRYVPWEIKERA